MNFNTVKLIYFSPTGTTRKVLTAIAGGMQVDTVKHLDLTPPEARIRPFTEMHAELAVIGAPVYGGRIPTDAKYRLQRIKATNTPAVIVVMYGNREYEDALLELNEIVVETGFRPVAGGAFIGEHSFENDSTPIAKGRPDIKDLQKATQFGRTIREKLMRIKTPDEIHPLQLPGNFPYRKELQPPNISPITDETLCTKCEACANACPTAAITVSDKILTERNLCILCCACIKICPSGARVWEDPWVGTKAEWLSTNYYHRKEPEIYVE
jgi:ferredoxin